ncbi:MAG: helix-turn-helix domain-containing protein, partial [Verrucomicrobiales bacterium]
SDSAPADLDAAAALLFEAAKNDPDLKLLPWLEREMCRRTLEATEGDEAKAAKLLGITRAALKKRS